MSDVLFILKENKPLTTKDVYNSRGLQFHFHKWNRETGEYIFEPESVKELDLDEYDEFNYTGNTLEPITTCRDRMEYAYACMHEDNFVDNVIMGVLPYVMNIKKPARRGTTDYYLQAWMKKYDFTLEDFIFNDRYVVIHDSWAGHEIENLIDCGFIDWDKIEHCSEYEIFMDVDNYENYDEADALKVQAEAEAEANRKVSNSITDEIIKKMYYESWDGKLPSVITGDASSTMIQIPKE